jgi:hypothetical protein
MRVRVFGLRLPTAIISLAIVLGACSSGGFLQPAKSSGTVVATVVGQPAPMQNTTAATALHITGGFAVKLTEVGYSAEFTASPASFSASMSCYIISMDATGTIATFTPKAASTLSGSAATLCSQPGGDVESVLFQDQQNHTNLEYFTNIPAGPITVGIFASLYNTSTPLGTTAQTALAVTNAFSLLISESGYTGPFTGNIISFTAPATAPCYGVTMDPTGQVATLTPKLTTGSCLPPNADIEAVQFEDSHGNISLPMYFTNSGVQSTSTPTVTLIGGGVVQSSILAPFSVDPSPLPTSPAAIGFSVMVTSPNGGPYTATLVSWTAQTIGPCYAPLTSTTNVFTFVPATPASVATPAPSPTPNIPPVPTPTPIPSPPNPCLVVGGDVEGVLFIDSRGSYDEQFFKH